MFEVRTNDTKTSAGAIWVQKGSKLPQFVRMLCEIIISARIRQKLDLSSQKIVLISM